jgi:hypothetical protein
MGQALSISIVNGMKYILQGVQFHPLDLISETHDLKKVFLSMIQSMVIDQEAAPILQAKILTFRVTQQAHKNLMPKRKRLQLLKTLKMV